jgi:phosphoribosylamine--glycine ligase
VTPSRVLVVGSGGREHALVWKLASERGVSDIICAPGNAGIARVARCIPVDAADPHALVAIAQREEIDFTIIGPELPLSRGVADVFADEGLLLFGPTQRAARLESSKVFAKEFMQRTGIPTARYKTCDSAADAMAILRHGEFSFPVVLKADGLAAGKGVVISPDIHDAESQVHSMMVDKRFGQAGARLVIEELLVGREASFFVLCDGTRAVPIGSAEDHKRALDGDNGPNTGGMGAYAPSALFDAATETRVMNEVVQPVLDGMRSEGSEFRGFLFVGLMLTAEVVLPMVTDDLSTLLMGAAAGEIGAATISRDGQCRVGVVLASGGYPDTYDTGKVVHGIEAAEALPDVNVFHSGTMRRGTDVVSNGGRVLTVVASGATYRMATSRAYEAAGKISFDGMHYRRDIAAKALI